VVGKRTVKGLEKEGMGIFRFRIWDCGFWIEKKKMGRLGDGEMEK
jgi:hypothetical protein